MLQHQHRQGRGLMVWCSKRQRQTTPPGIERCASSDRKVCRAEVCSLSVRGDSNERECARLCPQVSIVHVIGPRGPPPSRHLQHTIATGARGRDLLEAASCTCPHSVQVSRSVKTAVPVRDVPWNANANAWCWVSLAHICAVSDPNNPEKSTREIGRAHV